MKRTAGWSCSVFFLFLPTLLRKLHGDGCCTEPSEKFRVRPRYDYEKKHVSRDFKMSCYCCRFCCGAPTTDERIHAPVLHDASQIDYCRYWGRASLPPITSSGVPGIYSTSKCNNPKSSTINNLIFFLTTTTYNDIQQQQQQQQQKHLVSGMIIFFKSVNATYIYTYILSKYLIYV